MSATVSRGAAGASLEGGAAWRFAQDLAQAAVSDEEGANLWAAGTIGAICLAVESPDRPDDRANARRVLVLLEAALAGRGPP